MTYCARFGAVRERGDTARLGEPMRTCAARAGSERMEGGVHSTSARRGTSVIASRSREALEGGRSSSSGIELLDRG